VGNQDSVQFIGWAARPISEGMIHMQTIFCLFMV